MRRSVLLLLAVLSLLLPLAALGPTATARDAHRASDRGAAGLVITFRGWGRLHLGMTPREAQRTGMVSTRLDHCAPGYQLTEPFASRAFLVWKATKRPWTISSVILHTPADHTAKGIHVGSTLRQLRAQYPLLSKVKHAAAFGSGGVPSRKDVYAAAVKRPFGALTFQFALGPRPGPGTPIESIVVSRKPSVFLGC